MGAERLPEDGNIVISAFRWIYLILAFLLALIVIPLLLPVSLIVRIYRNVLGGKIKKKLGDKNVILATGNDAVWLQDTPNNRAIINAILSLKAEPDLEMLRNMVYDRMVAKMNPDDPSKPLFPKMSMYCTRVMRRYVWVKEEDLKIEEHIHMCEHSPKTKEELQVEVGKICSRGLPEKKSPWEVVIMPPIEGTDEYIVTFRVHHSIGDGISLVRAFMTSLADEPPVEPKSNRFGARGGGMVTKVLKAIIEGPGTVLLRVFQTKNHNILHGPHPTGIKHVAWSKQIDLELIKKMKNATGTTVNDVLFSCLAGALGDYIRNNSENPPRDICASVPVDMRKSKKLEMDNQFAVVFVDLPLDETDPVKLLRRMKKRMDALKASSEPLVNNLLISFSMARLPNWLSEFLLNFLTDKCSMVVSNVPGPAVNLKIKGQLVDDLLFWPPQRNNVSMGVSILSYAGHIRIGMMTDEAVLDNPSILTDLFLQKVYALASALKVE